MVRSNKVASMFSAVLAGLPVAALLMTSGTVYAQFRTGADGHFNDANTRAGSGGYNSPTDASNRAGLLNSNIVTGNVSGLGYFHGNNNGEFDSNVFQGGTGSGNSDFLNAISAPNNNAARNTGQQPNVTPYYNTSNYVGASAPAGFVSNKNGTGLIPAPQISALTPNADTRLQDSNVDTTADNLAAPGETDMAGPVDTSGKPSLYSMSPLYGVKPAQDDANANGDSTFFTSRTSNARNNTATDRNRLSAASLQKLRDEVKQTALTDNQSAQSNAANPDGTPGISDTTNLAKGAQLDNAGTDVSSKLSGTKSLDSSVSNQTLKGDLASGESVENSLVVAPAKQSKQLAELERRFAVNDKTKLTPTQATERFNAEKKAQETKPPGAGTDLAAASKAGRPADSAAGAEPIPGMPIDPSDKVATRAPLKAVLPGPESQIDTTPYVITSLATGIQAKGLADLMKNAEVQMRQGKFIEAVDSYQTAQLVAPNNPFVPLGRSFAELGASYYGKADQDLSRAVDADPAILAGEYDLKGFVGEDRLTFVQKDLQNIASEEPGAQPTVLLAFIAHNTGDDKSAARYLENASARGGYAKLIDQMRRAWKIEAAGK